MIHPPFVVSPCSRSRAAPQDEDFADEDMRQALTGRKALRRWFVAHWKVAVPVVMSALVIIAGIVLQSLKTQQTVRTSSDARGTPCHPSPESEACLRCCVN